MNITHKHDSIRNVFRKITTYQKELNPIDQEIEKTRNHDKLSKLLKKRQEIETKMRLALIDLEALNTIIMNKDKPPQYRHHDYSAGSKKKRTKKRYLRRKRSSTITRYPGQ